MSCRIGVLVAMVVGWAAVLPAQSVPGQAKSSEQAHNAPLRSGAIAIASPPGSPWQSSPEGTPPSARCAVRAGFGPGLQRLDGAKLTLQSDAEVVLDPAENIVELRSGTLLLAADGKAWRVLHGPVQIELDHSTAQVARATDGSLMIGVTHGSAKLLRQGEARIVSEKQGLTLSPDGKAGESRPLSEAVLDEMAAWPRTSFQGHGLGRLSANLPGDRVTAELELVRCYVHTELQPGAALVRIDESFYNSMQGAREGHFVFDLPPGASICRFAMFVTPTQLVEGELVRRDQGQRVYNAIVSRRLDPALLEQVGENRFRIRVFPIPANSTKRLLLDFTVPLDDCAGYYALRLPMGTGEKPIADFRLTGELAGALPGSFSPGALPWVQVGQVGDEIRFHGQQKPFAPKEDLAFRFAANANAAAGVRACRMEARQRGFRPTDSDSTARPWIYFCATLPRMQNEAARPAPADVLLLADTSQYARGTPRIVQAVSTVLAHLRPEDRFRLAGLDLGCRFLDQDWRPATAENVAEAQAALRRQVGLGQAHTAQALHEALRALGEPGPRRRLIFYAGSGDEDSEPQEETRLALAEGLAKSRASLVALGIGASSTSIARLEELAGVCGGRVFDPSVSAGALASLFTWLQAGMPSPERVVRLKVAGVQDEDLFYRPGLMPGEPLVVYGRTQDASELRVEYRLARGKEVADRQSSLTLSPEPRQWLVGRFWAEHRLRQLERAKLPRAFDEGGEALNLAQEWSLLTPETAYLVLESEEDYAQWKIDRRQRRRYWSEPERVVEPSPRAPSVNLEPSRKPKSVVRAPKNPDPAQSPVVEREVLLNQFGLRRGLVDHLAQGDRSLLTSPPGWFAPVPVCSDFWIWHRYARQLLREGPVPAGCMTLEDLIHRLKKETGANVFVDVKHLQHVGVELETKTELLGSGLISLRALAQHVLKQMSLVMVEEPHQLWITNEDEADAALHTDVYPLSDLLDSRRLPDMDQLGDPYLDQDLKAEQRISERLKRPVDMDFLAATLTDVARHIGQQCDIPVLIDCDGLKGVGQKPHAAWIDVTCHDVPARVGLEWVLRQRNLAWTIRHEALLITSHDEADESVTTRVHSARGVVYLRPRPDDEFGGLFLGGGSMGGPSGGRGGYFAGGGYFGGRAFSGGGGGGGFFGGSGSLGAGAFGGSFGGSFGGDAPLIDGAGLSAGGAGGFDRDPDFRTVVEDDGISPRADETPRATYVDFHSLEDVIERTVHPVQWDAAGGSNSLSAFVPTLDVVTRATREVQTEVEQLLERLRGLPIVPGQQIKVAQAPPRSDPDRNATFAEMAEMVTKTLAPTSWDEVGGSCTLTPDAARQVFIVSASAEVHDEVHQLLTQLRRSRWQALRGTRPWETSWSYDGQAPWDALFGIPQTDPHGEAELPPPKPEVLRLLAVRRPAANQRWQRIDPGRKRPIELGFCRDGARRELQLPQVRARIEGNAAAVAWPDRLCAQVGPPAPWLPQWLDALLPWMPHRTNEELAREFDVRPLKDKSDTDERVRLRFGFPGLAVHRHSLDVTFSRRSGEPVAWEARFDGRTTFRLDFQGTDTGSARRVELHDASGRLLATWRRMEDGPGSVPALTDWPGYVLLDRRADVPEADPEFFRAWNDLAKADWPQAAKDLDASLQRHPDHPLLLVLRAWCRDRIEGVAGRGRTVDDLCRAAAGPASDLLRLVDEAFVDLTAQERLKILSCQPAPQRSADDWLRLARTAAEAGQKDESLAHVRKALDASDGESLESLLSAARTLHRVGQTPEALARVRRWREAAARPASELLRWADELASWNQTAEADAILAGLLEGPPLSPEATHAVRMRRVGLFQGFKRWLLLREAADKAPLPRMRELLLQQFLEEVGSTSQAKSIRALADREKDPATRDRLLLCFAENTSDDHVAADVYWDLFQRGALPEGSLASAYPAFAGAEQPERALRILEDRLRKRTTITTTDLNWLVLLYRQAGRTEDAHRAESEHP